MFLPFHIHTKHSVLDGIIDSSKLAKKCKELNYSHCAITDHGNISGSVDFALAMEKEGVIPVFGNEFYCYEKEDERDLKHTVVLAKNLQGWKKLVKLTSLSNQKFYYKPRIHFDDLVKAYDKDLLIFSGHYGSILGDSLSETDAIKFQEAFGDDFYIELQRFLDNKQADKMRAIADKLNIRSVACIDAHYLEKKDVDIHRIVLCSNLKLTLRDIKRGISNGQDVPMSTFFTKDCFYLFSEEELRGFGHTEEEIDCSDILAKIEKYSILSNPIVPKFDTHGKTEIEFLKDVCRAGWKKKYKDVWNTKEYVDRLNKEFEIIEEFDLAGYLLVVWDYIKFAKDRNVLVGAGRGSSAGSLVCYLMGITEVEPIKYGLIFERFINASRFYSNHVNFQEYDYLTNYKASTNSNTFKWNEKRLAQIQTNPNYTDEMYNISTKMTNGLQYYHHIIHNVEIDKTNPNNSYIMWACDKVDELDQTKPCKIVPARSSLPDIDTDFPPFFRDSIINYIRTKYGENKVAQIATFGSIKGKSAIKEVVRVTEICSFEEANIITQHLPEEAKIIDDMHEVKETSIILYTLKYLPNLLKDYVTLVDGKIIGEYSELFKMAIELEGNIKSIGRHAAGLVVSPVPIEEICPIIKVGSENVVGFDKIDVEKMGLIKFDILGVSSLEKLMGINELLRYGKFVEDKIAHYTY